MNTKEENKSIFAKNLKKYMDLNDKSRRDVSEALGVSYFTFCDWVCGKKYPRMDKVEKLANYFGIKKSDLIEEKTEDQIETQKKADTITGAVLRMKKDSDFLSLIEMLSELDPEKIKGVQQMLSAFLK